MLIIIIIISAGGYCLGFRLSRRPHWSPEVPGSTAFCLAQGQGFKLNRSCTPLLATRTHKAQSSHFGSKVQAILAQAKRPAPTAVYGSFSTIAWKKKTSAIQTNSISTKREPEENQKEPRGSRMAARASQKGTRGSHKETQRSQRGAKRERQWNQQESKRSDNWEPTGGQSA